MVSKGFRNVTTSGRQYNIGEKPPLYCTLTAVTTYDGGGSTQHTTYVRATELQQALEAEIYIYENNYQFYVASFKCVISMKYFRITTNIDRHRESCKPHYNTMKVRVYVYNICRMY